MKDGDTGQTAKLSNSTFNGLSIISAFVGVFFKSGWGARQTGDQRLFLSDYQGLQPTSAWQPRVGVDEGSVSVPHGSSGHTQYKPAGSVAPIG
jgi:hypothetical protein